MRLRNCWNFYLDGFQGLRKCCRNLSAIAGWRDSGQVLSALWQDHRRTRCCPYPRRSRYQRCPGRLAWGCIFSGSSCLSKLLGAIGDRSSVRRPRKSPLPSSPEKDKEKLHFWVEHLPPELRFSAPPMHIPLEDSVCRLRIPLGVCSCCSFCWTTNLEAVNFRFVCWTGGWETKIETNWSSGVPPWKESPSATDWDLRVSGKNRYPECCKYPPRFVEAYREPCNL